jgi:TolA-binding protein
MITGGTVFRRAGLAAVSVICLSVGSIAHAGIFDDDEARRAILEMRQKIDVNRALVDKMAEEQRRAGDASARSLLSLQNQIDALKSDLATSRGQNEQLTRDVSDLQKQQKSISQNVEQRLREVEPAKVSMDGADFSVAPAEQQDFDAALAMFKQGNFAGAQSAFLAC